ncbi:MAG: EAL domain-containing protein [bacterium]|nr:EAL domain-containing protein [bacterium]
MLKKIRKRFLARYKDADYIDNQKSAVLFTLICVLLIIIPVIIVTYIIGEHNSIQMLLPPIVLLFIMAAALVLLVKGHYKISANLVLITLLTAVWFILFFDEGKPKVSRLDTIIYIAGILSMTPLIIVKRKAAIIGYYIANILIFIGFVYKANIELNLNPLEVSGYFLDNIMVFIFMSVISYQVFNINKNALDRNTKNQRDLAENRKKYKELYENAMVGMATSRLSDGILTEANNRACNLLGYTPEEIIGKLPMEDLYFTPEGREELLEMIQEDKEVHNHEVLLKRKDSSSLWCEISARIFPEEGEIRGFFQDISKRKIAEEHVHWLTFYDTLTGLPNKKMLLQKIKTQIDRRLRKTKNNQDKIFAVLCVGVDKFKYLNDMHGQVIGDELLRKIAERLAEVYREDDTLTRFSGDKFMVLLSDIASVDDVMTIIRKTSDAFITPFTVEEVDFHITSSSGVSIYPNDGEDPEVLIKNSETALYRAKEKGRDSYQIFDAELNSRLLSHLQLEKELWDAISLNEFEPFFQPKVDKDGIIIGMESLIRWQSSKRGLISPFHFIPLAERNGMILDIGKIILYLSCLQNKKWQDLGFAPKRVAVNISPFQFMQKDLVETVEQILVESKLDAQWLELEITESGIMDNESEAIEKLNRIHEMGIAISIDDFGTGYSSLSKLKDYPLDTLKIDKSFVDNLPDHRKSATIATSIIDLAHNLGCKVVAEGIETKGQLDFLLSRNCDQYQGYLFSKPVSSEEFEKLFKLQFIEQNPDF